jgi:hypothetical protein
MRILDPRTWFQPRGRTLLIDHGRVGCPNRGDADLERCYTCGHMLAVTDGRNPKVICDFGVDDRLAAFVRRSG